MKNRLLELFSKFRYTQKQGEPFTENDAHEQLADYLIREGVIVPPVSIIGQTVYVPWIYGGTKGIAFFEVTHIIIDCNKSYVRTNFEKDDEGFWEEFDGGQFDFEDFGKTVFLTREAAVAALEAHNATS